MSTQIKGNDTSTFGGAIQTNESSIVSNRPIVVATLSSAQSVTDATWTKAQLATEEIDTDSAFDNATNYRFTVPTGKAGKYQISASIGYDGLSNNNNGRLLLQVYINGTGIYPRADVNFTTSYQRYSYLTTSFVKDLSEGDYVELWGYCDAISGNIEFEPANTYLSIHKLIG
jgi:hypothetical protein